jgi:hypothetical protein
MDASGRIVLRVIIKGKRIYHSRVQAKCDAAFPPSHWKWRRPSREGSWPRLRRATICRLPGCWNLETRPADSPAAVVRYCSICGSLWYSIAAASAPSCSSTRSLTGDQSLLPYSNLLKTCSLRKFPLRDHVRLRVRSRPNDLLPHIQRCCGSKCDSE